MDCIDLRFLTWDKNLNELDNSSCTGGTFYKAFHDNIYYKLSNYDNFVNKFIGYESVFEVIVYKLVQILGIPTLRYELEKAIISINNVEQETYLCKSYNFIRPSEKKLTLEDFCYGKSDKELLKFCIDSGFEDDINRIFLLDFLICNRDRHGANIEVLKSNRGYRFADLYDNGISFVQSYGMDFNTIANLNGMSDFTANNFLGSRSLIDNLNLITKPVIVNSLVNNYRDIISEGIKEALNDIIWDKVFEMIERRYQYAKDKIFLIER